MGSGTRPHRLGHLPTVLALHATGQSPRRYLRLLARLATAKEEAKRVKGRELLGPLLQVLRFHRSSTTQPVDIIPAWSRSQTRL